MKKNHRHLFFLLLILQLSSCSSTTPSTYKIEYQRGPATFQSCLMTMNNIISYKVHTGAASVAHKTAKSLDELEASYGGESLIDIQRFLSNEEIKTNNLNLKKLLAADFELTAIPDKKNFVTRAEADVIYKAMQDSRVHKNHDCYDTKGTIGFCFGRATIAHMEAIVRNVHPEAIRKIWIAGDMEKWGHHVATMVKSENGWLVLDTNVGRAINTDEWIAMYMPFKAKGADEIMVFVTQAGRFGPYNTSSYNALDLFNTNGLNFNKAQDYYRGYFHDYFEDLDNVSNSPPQFIKP